MMKYSQLLQSLLNRKVLFSPSLIDAFEKVDRADFVRDEFKMMAYEDIPLSIGFSQTISQPYTVAFMLELLELQASDKVLDVGSGSGWTTALLACVVTSVDAVERIEELLDFARGNLSRYKFTNITLHKAQKSLGLEGRVFDKILVSCAADEVPETLLRQLKVGGIMVIPIRESIVKLVKTGEDTFEMQKYPGFVFVPLIKDD